MKVIPYEELPHILYLTARGIAEKDLSGDQLKLFRGMRNLYGRLKNSTDTEQASYMNKINRRSIALADDIKQGGVSVPGAPPPAQPPEAAEPSSDSTPDQTSDQSEPNTENNEEKNV